MATSFHLFLKNRQKQNGEYPIYLRITNNRKHKYVSTGISVKEKHWNPGSEEVRRNHDNYNTLNETLRDKVKEAERVQSELSKNGHETAKAIRERIKNTQKADFFELGEHLLKELEANKKYYASKTLKVVLKKFEEFEGERSLPLKRIDGGYLESFEQFLKTEYGNSDSTINKNFEPIRKIIQRAFKSHLMANDPFKEYEVPTRSRAKQKTKLSFEQIQDIEALKLEPGSWEWHVRNAFLFSFYSGGIRFGDICGLKWENVKNGKLSYQMNKNEKSFSTELNDYQKDILSRYSGALHEYIFPFLNSHNDYSDPVELRRAISSNNVLVNGKKEENKETGLKLIAKMAGIDENVSFHVSRHSFAQYAVSEKGLDVYELMQTLRHSKIETTQSYLKSLNEELADKAMKKVF
ncbi:MAG: site-specific integrase [Candidatus Paceibacterota bacterium]